MLKNDRILSFTNDDNIKKSVYFNFVNNDMHKDFIFINDV